MRSRHLAAAARCLALGLALVSASSGCHKPPPAPSSSEPDATSGPQPTSDPASRITALLRAENQRSTREVRDEDLASPSATVRRQAARMLARVDDPKVADRLLGLLADGDPEVLAWAAYGLGEICEANRDRSGWSRGRASGSAGDTG